MQTGQPTQPQTEPAVHAERVVPAAPSELPIERASEIELFVSGKATNAVSTNIRQFGYDLFRQPPSTFAPVDKVPVGPDYVIGPGDEIKVTVWGKVEGQWSVVVDRDGNIALPKIGIMGVTGLTFQELKETLYKEFSKYFGAFEMNVSMGSLRSIRVYIVGNAARPGAYTVSALSTLINALFEAGGPSKVGTMRAIELKRNGKTVMVFDMYDFLLRGDKTKDMRLMPEDVIFIPSVGPFAGIAGNVKVPAIYELKGNTKLLDLIRTAGGLTSAAFSGRVQVQRIQDHRFITLFEGDMVGIGEEHEKNFALADGDIVKIYSVVDTKNTALVSGAVANPGEYGVVPGTTKVMDVISLAGGLLYYASDKAEITRVRVSQSGPDTETLTLDLKAAANGDLRHNVPLEVNDYILVHTVPEWRLYQTVTVTGEVRFPGTYAIKKGERLSSLIERSGGFTDKAYLTGAEFKREKIRRLQQERIDEMVERLDRELMSAGAAEVSTASTSDEAKIFQMESEHKERFIAGLKEVKAKGKVTIEMSPLEGLRKSPYDIELEEGDSLHIPMNPRTVQVVGSVYSQTAFIHVEGNGVKHYIKLAGGYTANADKGNVYVLKANGMALKASDVEGIESADTIVVPERLERIAWMRNTKDITQILFQIAVTAGVLIVLF
ncbi:MAG: SLBB domain-containing protein [Thermodesulfovibrionales bacterium]|nr:SLBB domain-containing protein [Thermodesulfovibrionales bacterium]